MQQSRLTLPIGLLAPKVFLKAKINSAHPMVKKRSGKYQGTCGELRRCIKEEEGREERLPWASHRH